MIFKPRSLAVLLVVLETADTLDLLVGFEADADVAPLDIFPLKAGVQRLDELIIQRAFVAFEEFVVRLLRVLHSRNTISLHHITRAFIKTYGTLEDFVLLLSTGFEVKHVVVQFFGDKLVLLEALIGDVEDGVLVSGLIVHIEDYVGLGNGDDAGDVSRLWLDPVLADGDVHVGCVSLKQLHGSERGEVAHGFGLERVAVVALEVPAHDAVLE